MENDFFHASYYFDKIWFLIDVFINYSFYTTHVR